MMIVSVSTCSLLQGQWSNVKPHYRTYTMFLVRVESSMFVCVSILLQRGTSRQRSGKGAVRIKFPLQKLRREKTN